MSIDNTACICMLAQHNIYLRAHMKRTNEWRRKWKKKWKKSNTRSLNLCCCITFIPTNKVHLPFVTTAGWSVVGAVFFLLCYCWMYPFWFRIFLIGLPLCWVFRSLYLHSHVLFLFFLHFSVLLFRSFLFHFFSLVFFLFMDCVFHLIELSQILYWRWFLFTSSHFWLHLKFFDLFHSVEGLFCVVLHSHS